LRNEFNGLNPSSNVIRVIKSREMKRSEHVTRMAGRGEVHTEFWWGKLRERDHFEDLGIDGGILKLKWKKWNGGVG